MDRIAHVYRFLQRVAASLLALSAEPERRPGLLSFGGRPITITHEQVAALIGTSRETTKALGDLAERAITFGRGKVTVLDQARLADESAPQ